MIALIAAFVVPGALIWATVAITGGESMTIQTGHKYRFKVPNAHLWTPDDPFLYPVAISLSKDLPGGARITNGENVTSYFAMRKISVGKDEKGIPRLMLNNKPLFQIGPLVLQIEVQFESVPQPLQGLFGQLDIEKQKLFGERKVFAEQACFL